MIGIPALDLGGAVADTVGVASLSAVRSTRDTGKSPLFRNASSRTRCFRQYSTSARAARCTGGRQPGICVRGGE